MMATAHTDSGEDMKFLLNSVINTISIPFQIKMQKKETKLKPSAVCNNSSRVCACQCHYTQA